MILDDKTLKMFDDPRVDKRLLNLVKEVASRIDAELPGYSFRTTEVMRTPEQQKINIAKGVSQTMNSYHLKGKAFDIYLKTVPLNDPKGNWKFSDYKKVADLFKKVAIELGYKITWGGDWKTLVDSPHFQIEN